MKKQKLLVLMGSPRKKGTSSTLAMEAARGAQDAGAGDLRYNFG